VARPFDLNRGLTVHDPGTTMESHIGLEEASNSAWAKTRARRFTVEARVSQDFGELVRNPV
jgi:hypothetical protein